MTNSKYSHYVLLANLFDYPDKNFVDNILLARKFLISKYDAVKYLDNFLEFLPREDLHKMQELYMRSFDVQAVTTLDIGYVLFGDDYKRGEVLVNMGKEHKKVNNNCGFELADHLPNVLRLMPLMQDQKLLEELVVELIAPALKKMIHEFAEERIETRNKFYKKHYKTLIEQPVNNSNMSAIIYVNCLKALFGVLEQDFKLTDRPKPKIKTNFLKVLDKEIEIDAL